MEAVILKNGKAVRKTNLKNCKYDIEDGMLVAFDSLSENKAVRYFDKEDFNQKLIDKNFLGGYFYIDNYSNYCDKPSINAFNEFVANGNYKNFVEATDGDEIEIDIVSWIDLTTVYNEARYSFIHNKLNNYSINPDGSLGFNPIFYDNSPQITNSELGTISKKFFDNHKIFINNDIDYYKKLVKCCVRINMIIDDIFKIYNQNLMPNDEISTLVASFMNSFTSNWSYDLIFDENISFDKKKNRLINFYNALYAFYVYSFKFQKRIINATPIDKLKWLTYLAKTEILNSVNPYYKISLLSSISKSLPNEKSTEFKKFSIETILLLTDSFVEEVGNSNRIDNFLTGLIDPKNAVDVNSIDEKENESPSFISTFNHLDTRKKITLFEFIYNLLTPSVVVQLWRYSDLHKKITASFNVNDDDLDPRSHFINLIYMLWVKSSFNPTKGGVYNDEYFSFNNDNFEFKYSRRPATTFSTNQDGKIISSLNRSKSPLIVNIDYYYINAAGVSVDTIKTRFCDFSRILIQTNDIRNANLDASLNLSINTLSQFNTKRAFFSFGYYDIFQAIQVVYSNVNDNSEAKIFNHTWNEIDSLNSQNYIPAFLFHYMQKKEDEEFMYNLAWVTIKAFYNALPNSTYKRTIDSILNQTNEFFGYFEDSIEENEFEYINEYAKSCSISTSNNEFCQKINILCYWLNQKQVAKSEILDSQIRDSAFDIIIYVNQNNWPTNFDNELAKTLIEGLADGGGICSDLKQIIVNLVNEENQNSAKKNVKASFSLYDSNNNNIILYTDQDYEDVCNHVTNLDILDDFETNSKKEILVAFLFNAHRVGKQANVVEVKKRLSLWANLKKPIVEGGRNKIPYVFGLNTTVAQNNYNAFVPKMHELFGHYDFLQYVDKRIGGSSLYKDEDPKPGDLDMYLFISHNEIKNLVEQIGRDWEKYVNNGKDKSLIKKAKGYINRVKKVYDENGFIFGYLIIKYDEQSETFFIMDKDRYDQYYTSNLVNCNDEPSSFDITIKDNSIDNSGTPPYIKLNI